MEKENFIIIIFRQARARHEYKDGIVSQADQEGCVDPSKNFFTSHRVFYNIDCYHTHFGVPRLGYLNDLENFETCLEACNLSPKCRSVLWHCSWLGSECDLYEGLEPASYNKNFLDLFIISASRNSLYHQSCSYDLQSMTFSPAMTAYKSCPQLRLNTA